VFKTGDGGAAWQPARAGLTFFPIRCMVADPQHPGVLYAGTDFDGVWKTVDGGESWSDRSSGLDKERIVLNLVLDPQNPDTLYAALAGGPGLWVGDIFKSTNGGLTWQKKDAGLPRSPDDTYEYANGIYALAIDPAHPNSVYAGTTYDGAFHSTNGGESWTAINTGLPLRSGSTEYYETVHALAWDPHHTRLSAIIAGRYYVLENNAWRKLQVGTWYANSSVGRDYLYFHPTDSNIIYSAGSYFNLSMDGGLNWEQKLGWDDASHIVALAFHPSTPDVIYAAADILPDYEGGVWKTEDRGETWSLASYGISAQPIQSVAADPADPQKIYAGTGEGGFFYRTSDGGSTWSRGSYRTTGNVVQFSFGAIQDLAVDPLHPAKIFLAGVRFFVSTDGGETFTLIEAVENPLSIAQPAQASNPVYTGTRLHGVFKSTDGGQNWTSKINGLPTFGSHINPILTLTVDPHDPNRVWAGMQYGGGIYKTTNGGDLWVTRGLTETNFVEAIAVHPVDSNTILVGAGFYQGSIYKSIDGGDTWRETISGIALVQEILYDPRDPNWVYALTEGYGMLRSSNGGESWFFYNDGIFYPVMYSATFTAGSPPRLVAGSYGSGLYWIEPDISTPLEHHLFAPFLQRR
jgi:photosystem II stability/assembly factor-like uncharacterized protein